jgi:hypothetical protein
LNKSGLKQAPRAWHSRFASHITSLGFVEAKADTSLFLYRCGADTAFLLLYVDDIVLTASSQSFLQHIIAALQQEFSMIDMGPLHHFLVSQLSVELMHYFSLSGSICWIFWTVLVCVTASLAVRRLTLMPSCLLMVFRWLIRHIFAVLLVLFSTSLHAS